MEIEGKIIRDIPLQQGVSKAGNQWKKKEWVLETSGQYPKQVCFQFFGDRVDQNQLVVGETYVISYDLESREYNGRWYTDVRAYASRKVDNGGGISNEPGSDYGQGNQFGTPNTGAGQFSTPAPDFGGQTDDLPF